jgi:hypothetical protein
MINTTMHNVSRLHLGPITTYDGPHTFYTRDITITTTEGTIQIELFSENKDDLLCNMTS